MANGNKSKSGVGRLKMLPLPRCCNIMGMDSGKKRALAHQVRGFSAKREGQCAG